LAISLGPEDSVIQIQGKGFVFLPLPKYNQFPIYINSYFLTSSSRRDIFIQESHQSTDCILHDWNQSLISQLIPKAYCLAIENLKKFTPDSSYLDIIPNNFEGMDEVFFLTFLSFLLSFFFFEETTNKTSFGNLQVRK